MSLIEKATSLLTGEEQTSAPVGTIHVVDRSPLNWFYITYNTVEELEHYWSRRGDDKDTPP